MGNIPIAVQLYSVRNDCAADFLGVLRRVADMGYEGVEFAGYHGHSVEAIRKVLDETGLKVAGTHTGIDQLADDKIGETIAFMKALGNRFVIVPGLPEDMRNTPEACAETAKRFSALAGRLASEGMQTGFHCHFADVQPLSGGISAWYLLGRQTPAGFVMQYDTANGMSGGADPVQPILDFPGRGATMHLKEWKGAHGAALIGDGDVPWAKVFEACESVAGTKWYIVEHEDESLMPPMEAVDKCLQNLRRMGK